MHRWSDPFDPAGGNRWELEGKIKDQLGGLESARNRKGFLTALERTERASLEQILERLTTRRTIPEHLLHGLPDRGAAIKRNHPGLVDQWPRMADPFGSTTPDPDPPLNSRPSLWQHEEPLPWERKPFPFD